MAILKVRTGNEKGEWWEFHNVRRISHSGYVSRAEFEDKFHPDVCFLDGEKEQFNLAKLQYMDGKEQSVLFSKEAYIMNDTGETTSIIPEA